MQWMMLFVYLLLFCVVILYMTSSTLERFLSFRFWGVTYGFSKDDLTPNAVNKILGFELACHALVVLP